MVRALVASSSVLSFSARTLTLVNPDERTGLVVDIGGEDLGLLDGDSRVSLDEGSRDAAGGLNTEGGETLSENES